MKYAYTGRSVAIFTDVHGVLEPLEAVIYDIKRRGISEIYSLGDNIGVGPSPTDVIDMIEYYNIRAVSGNAEEYCNIGIAPYHFSFSYDKIISHEWTYLELGKDRLKFINELPHSYEVELGGKRIGLCHFANDIRTDYEYNGTEKYLNNFNNGEAYKQFLYNNSIEHRKRVFYNINKYGINDPCMKGYVSFVDYPMFDGKTVDEYDTIIQGHVHRNLYEYGNGIEFCTIRPMAIHFDKYPIDKAFYIILHERCNNMGFDIEEVYVPFDRDRMINTILNSSEPSKRIRKMVRM